MYLQTIIIFKEVLGLENLFLYSSIPFCLSNKYRGGKKKGIEVFLALRLDMLYELFDLRETVCDTETWKFDTLVEHLLVGNKLSPVGKCKSYTNFIPPYFILPHCFFFTNNSVFPTATRTYIIPIYTFQSKYGIYINCTHFFKGIMYVSWC